MNATKIQHDKWAVELLTYFNQIGVDEHCEWRTCTSHFGLAPAHSKKRRFIGLDRGLYFEAANLCVKHHSFVEYGDRKHKGTHRRMERLIKMVILGRVKRGGEWSLTFTMALIKAAHEIPSKYEALVDIKPYTPRKKGQGWRKLIPKIKVDKEDKVMMQEELDGYRRSAVKTRDPEKLKQKVAEFEARGEEVMVLEEAGISYIYLRKEKPL